MNIARRAQLRSRYFAWRIAFVFIRAWYWLTVLPSLDLSIELPDGSTLYPSAGTPGSCFKTRDGQHYVRTGRGNRKVGKITGEMLIARSKRIRQKAIAQRVVVVAAAVIVIASLAALSLSPSAN